MTAGNAMGSPCMGRSKVCARSETENCPDVAVANTRIK